MAQVMDAHILEPGPVPDPLPERLQVGQRLAGEGTRNNVWVERLPLDRGKHVRRRLAEVHDLGAGFGIGSLRAA